MNPEESAIKFIGKFLTWYQGSFNQYNDINTIHRLEELVKEAENIHVEKLKAIDKESAIIENAYKRYKKAYKKVESNYNDKPTRILKKQVKRISRY